MADPSTHKNSPGKQRINPNIRRMRREELSLADYLAGLDRGDRAILSRAITLVESTRKDHQELAQAILENCPQPGAGATFRLGVTGSPGVGKSTFIDHFGAYLLEQGRRIAVLTIDPSSQLTGGSILGDKTRMEKLSAAPRAFVRPTAAGASLGGVARRTRESMILCEAAGFDTIIIETVGVGQSEIAVRALVDFFLLLLQPGAGDELQGIKRGIVEMADLLAVNKADGAQQQAADHARRAYRNAVHLMAPKPNGWPVKVVSCSAMEDRGLAGIWQEMREFRTFAHKNGSWRENRRQQARHWFRQSLNEYLLQLFYQHPAIKEQLPEIERSVGAGKTSPFRAAEKLIRLFIETNA